MRYHRYIFTLVTGALALGLLAAPAAFAQPRHRAHLAAKQAPPLTITRRSFLDYGTQAPVGSLQQYMVANTLWNVTPADANSISHFGGFENLPGRFGIGGRQEPLFTFSTGMGGP